MKTLSPERRELKERVGQCMACGKPMAPEYLDVHEIAAGGSREKCLGVPLLQLVLCRMCHETIQPWPPSRQIAVRVRWQIRESCLRYCEVKGLAPTAVEPADVVIHLMFQKPPRKRGKG